MHVSSSVVDLLYNKFPPQYLHKNVAQLKVVTKIRDMLSVSLRRLFPVLYVEQTTLFARAWIKPAVFLNLYKHILSGLAQTETIHWVTSVLSET